MNQKQKKEITAMLATSYSSTKYCWFLPIQQQKKKRNDATLGRKQTKFSFVGGTIIYIKTQQNKLPNPNVHPDHWIQDEYVKNQKLPSISAITKSENEKKKKLPKKPLQ